MTAVVKIVALADTHGKRPAVPSGDVLIHAGDLTTFGKQSEIEAEVEWIASLSHPHKVVIAGNHDRWCQRKPDAMKKRCEDWGIYYIDREFAFVAGLTIWGSPWTPKFFEWAFMYSRGNEARAHWADLPEGLDVLVTHGPPFGMGDRAFGRSVGCVQLLERLHDMRRPPRLHLFGHIHCDHGSFRLGDDHPTRFENVSTDYGKRAAEVYYL